MDGHTQQEHGPGMSNRTKLVLAGFLLIAGFFLLSEHRAHFLGLLPYLLLLACPLMHIYHGHGGHGAHGHGPGSGTADGGHARPIDTSGEQGKTS